MVQKNPHVEDEEEEAAPIVIEAARDYPRWIYHPDYEPVVVKSAADEEEFEGWYGSPADYGVVTCPSADQLRLKSKTRDYS